MGRNIFRPNSVVKKNTRWEMQTNPTSRRRLVRFVAGRLLGERSGKTTGKMFYIALQNVVLEGRKGKLIVIRVCRRLFYPQNLFRFFGINAEKDHRSSAENIFLTLFKHKPLFSSHTKTKSHMHICLCTVCKGSGQN